MRNFETESKTEGRPGPIGPGISLRRLIVPGGGGVLFRVGAGDRLRVTDPEGLQAAELFVVPAGAMSFDATNGVALIPSLAGGPERAHPGLTGADLLGAAALRQAFDDDPRDWNQADGFALFSSAADRGDKVLARAVGDALCMLLAPGAAPAPDEQCPPTEIVAEISMGGAGASALPEPLADAKLDLRVSAATAHAYRVAAGDFIQIIDVDGRQCSDFLAFDAKALEAGEESGIDPTTTRTLAGASYPHPGLHGKYFDARMQPLVEVVRDTVGRHDTFMLACAAKYYEDMGYPGHANCTDNFNVALAPFRIVARRGWPAINFFYNTIVGADGAIGLDEPWSRPGDYVLLRALTDLVCASSSCADDIDPANGWNPTDIHVRVYDASNAFSQGSAHRMTPKAEPKLTRDSGFHARTAALTRNFVDYRGFWLARSYLNEGPIAEYWACRERACLIDLSALRKFEIVGPDSEALLQETVTRDISKLAVGQIVYTAMCYPHGGMLDDGTVFRLGLQNFRWVCGDEYCGIWLREHARARGYKVWIKSATDHLHNVALQGPMSRDILRELVVTPAHRPSIAELKWFRFTVGRIGGTSGPAVLVSRTGYTGELGYEIWCHPNDAVAVWDALWEAGRPVGLAPLGLDALDMLRIEAGLIFAGFEFCDQTDPFAAGIGFAVPASKTADYVGAEVLARRRANSEQTLVGLDIEGAETIGHGDPVHRGRARIGVVTSATRSPILGRTIALARLESSYATHGTDVEVGKLDGQQKRIGGRVTGFPHFDREKRRVRA